MSDSEIDVHPVVLPLDRDGRDDDAAGIVGFISFLSSSSFLSPWTNQNSDPFFFRLNILGMIFVTECYAYWRFFIS